MLWQTKRALKRMIFSLQLEVSHQSTTAELYRQQCSGLNKELQKALAEAGALRAQIVKLQII